MPTLKLSSAVRAASPFRTTTLSPCFVPAPPGVNGIRVERLSTTCASSALCTVACTWNAFKNQ